MNISLLSVGALLAAGLLGVVMGLNRTFKTRDKESPVLHTVATIAGVLLIALAVYSMCTVGGTVGSARYVLPFLLILGLSLSARWLEGIHVTAVILLVLVLGVLYVLGQGGMPQSVTELLQKQNMRKLVIIAALVAGGTVFLLVSTLEKVVDLFLDILGQGLVVTALSVIGSAHAVVILASANVRGLMKYL